VLKPPKQLKDMADRMLAAGTMLQVRCVASRGRGAAPFAGVFSI
jgi:hypothetical protein